MYPLIHHAISQTLLGQLSHSGSEYILITLPI